jgi:hypothetical protein
MANTNQSCFYHRHSEIAIGARAPGTGAILRFSPLAGFRGKGRDMAGNHGRSDQDGAKQQVLLLAFLEALQWRYQNPDPELHALFVVEWKK